MITDEQREFIAQLTPEQFQSLNRRIQAYAAAQLRRRGLGLDADAAREVVGSAFERLISRAHCCWGDNQPTVEGLLEFLSHRVDDIVKKRRRRANRIGAHKEFDSQTDMRVWAVRDSTVGLAESTISLEELGDAWLDLASAQGEDTERVVLEYLTGNTSPRAQAEALNLHINAIYRLRSTAKQILSSLLAQRENDQ